MEECGWPSSRQLLSILATSLNKSITGTRYRQIGESFVFGLILRQLLDKCLTIQVISEGKSWLASEEMLSISSQV